MLGDGGRPGSPDNPVDNVADSIRTLNPRASDEEVRKRAEAVKQHIKDKSGIDIGQSLNTPSFSAIKPVDLSEKGSLDDQLRNRLQKNRVIKPGPSGR